VSVIKQFALVECLEEGVVRRSVEKVSGAPNDPYLHHPTVSVRFLIDEFRFGCEAIIDFHYFAIARSVEVRRGLDRLDDAKRLAEVKGGPDGRQLHEHDVAEGILGVMRNPDDGVIACVTEPFVLFRVPEVAGVHVQASFVEVAGDEAPLGECS
jgi:hypothetical protein